MAGTSKRRTRTKTVVVHQCNQEETLKRINQVLFGNGHPDDGLAFLVRQFMKGQIDVIEDIAHIRNDIGDLGKKYDTTKSALDRYKAEDKAFVAGKKEAEGNSIKTKVEKRADRQKNLQTIAVIVAALALILSTYFSWEGKRTSDVTNKKVDDLGIPITVTKGGKLYPLPDTVTIKMFNLNPADATSNDTIE